MDPISTARDRTLAPTDRAAAKLASANKLFVRERIDLLSQIVAILSAGTFFGALLAAPMGDRIGRRISLIISVAIFCIGVALQTAAMQIPMLIAGRYIALFRIYHAKQTDHSIDSLRA